MSMELWAVAFTSLLLLCLTITQQLVNDVKKGVKWALSNRDDQTHDATALRIGRAVANHRENAMVFAPLALAVVLADVTSTVTWWGAVLFMVARAGHAVTYGLGITGLRSGFWMLGVAGCVLTGWPLVSALI